MFANHNVKIFYGLEKNASNVHFLYMDNDFFQANLRIRCYLPFTDKMFVVLSHAVTVLVVNVAGITKAITNYPLKSFKCQMTVIYAFSVQLLLLCQDSCWFGILRGRDMVWQINDNCVYYDGMVLELDRVKLPKARSVVRGYGTVWLCQMTRLTKGRPILI